jgi:hypothetical protein
MLKLKPEDLLPPLNFSSYPIMEEIFTAIKNYLKKLSLGSKPAKGDRRSMLILVDDL